MRIINKYLVYSLILISLLSCSKNKQVIGDWNVLEANFQDENILGKRKGIITVGYRMSFDKYGNCILPYLDTNFKTANYKCFRKNGNLYLTIYNSEDIRYNNDYKIEIIKKSMGIFQEVKLKLISDGISLRAFSQRRIK